MFKDSVTSPPPQGQEGQENPDHPTNEPAFQRAQALVQFLAQLIQVLLGRELHPVGHVSRDGLRLRVRHAGFHQVSGYAALGIVSMLLLLT